MNNKLNCEIVRDLLPSYIDGLTSDETNRAVEEHVADCEECSAVLTRMKEPEEQVAAPTLEVDYLRKVRKRTARVGIICGIVMMLVGMVVVLAQTFLGGTAAGEEDVTCSVSVENNVVSVSGNAVSGTRGVARVVFEESAGIVNVKVYTAPRAFFNSYEFREEYSAQGSVGMVRQGDLILWYEGTEIDRTTSQLYEAINPFVGDMPANGRVASVLGIDDMFGPYTNELQTTTEPYGWILNLENPIDTEEESVANEVMRADSCVLLATVENLGYMTWKYDTEAGPREYTVTAEEASAFAGMGIKTCAQSPVELQNLLRELGIKWSGVREIFPETTAFTLNISNDSQTAVYGYKVSYYLNGEEVGNTGGINANESAIDPGDVFSFDFTPENFPEDTSSFDLAKFSFDLYALDEQGREIPVCKNMEIASQYAWTYSYTMTGDDISHLTLSQK